MKIRGEHSGRVGAFGLIGLITKSFLKFLIIYHRSSYSLKINIIFLILQNTPSKVMILPHGLNYQNNILLR